MKIETWIGICVLIIVAVFLAWSVFFLCKAFAGDDPEPVTLEMYGAVSLELEEANGIINSLVRFNNQLINDLEDCENGKEDLHNTRTR